MVRIVLSARVRGLGEGRNDHSKAMTLTVTVM